MNEKDLTNDNGCSIIEQEVGRMALVLFPCGEKVEILIPHDKGLDFTPIAEEEMAVFSLPFEHCEDCSMRVCDECTAKLVDYINEYFSYKCKGKSIMSFAPIPEEELRDYFELEGETEKDECEFI